MKTILTIARNDCRRLTGSVVGLVILIGICLLPCLYAWFNIFSNWDPYGPASTSRIPVAVASEDQGTELLGLELNVGDKLLDGLAANDLIGWVFADDKEAAVELVASGQCYAALVVPAGFSSGIVSFLNLDFSHPRILYYENGKTNAIAPKITAKARTAVQQEVNAAFLETLVGDAAQLTTLLNAGGLDPQATLNQLGDGLDQLAGRLSDLDSALEEISGISDSASALLLDSGDLLQSVGAALDCTQELAGYLAQRSSLSGLSTLITDLSDLTRDANAELTGVIGELEGALDGAEAFNGFLEQRRDARVSRLRALSEQAGLLAATAAALPVDLLSPRLQQLSGGLSDLADALSLWQPLLDDAALTEQEQKLAAVREASAQARQLELLLAQATADAVSLLDDGDDPLTARVSQAASHVSELISLLQGRAGEAGSALDGSAADLAALRQALSRTRSGLGRVRAELTRQAVLLRALADSEFLQDALALLSEQGGLLSGYVASPLRIEERKFYEVPSYGSQMAPFYTVLALWVGALFAAALLKTRLREQDRPAGLTTAGHFLGRFGVFLLVSLAQSLIVALGDLLYVEIDCVHPGLFLLAAVVIGLSFCLINYTLSFSLGSVGLGLSVIIMLIQVAGSGGTYPIEVLPPFFRVLCPVMPFRYAMDALREAVCGRYGDYYFRDLLLLLALAAGISALGLLVLKPARRLNDLIEKSKDKSGLMV